MPPVLRRVYAARGVSRAEELDTSFAALLDPAMFVIGGGVSEAGDLLLVPTRAAFEGSLVARQHRPLASVVMAELGNDAGVVGAADLARTLDD